MLEAAACVVKLVSYAASLAGAGATLAWASLADDLPWARPHVARVTVAAAPTIIVSAVAATALLTIQLGGVNAGVLRAVLQGPNGFALALQLGGASLLLATARGDGSPMVRMAAAIAILASFGVLGHPASMYLGGGVVTAAHVGAAAWWLGALLLLRHACTALPNAALARAVRRFSCQAVRIVTALLVAGALLALLLVRVDQVLRLTPYVQMLGAKVGVAATVLAVAVYNKFRLTPRVLAEDAGATHELRRSIDVEIALFAAVLAVTAWLTTFDSPHE